MAKKNDPTKGAPPAAPGATDAPPAAPGATDAPPAAPGATDAPPAAPGKKSWLIKVRPTKGAMYEPFQRVAIPEGAETPLESSDWVASQIEAGYLEKC